MEIVIYKKYVLSPLGIEKVIDYDLEIDKTKEKIKSLLLQIKEQKKNVDKWIMKSKENYIPPPISCDSMFSLYRRWEQMKLDLLKEKLQSSKYYLELLKMKLHLSLNH